MSGRVAGIEMRGRAERAAETQRRRGYRNARMPARSIRKECALDETGATQLHTPHARGKFQSTPPETGHEDSTQFAYREDILNHAYALAKSNQGAPGVDGQSFTGIEAAGLEEWLNGPCSGNALVDRTPRGQPGSRLPAEIP